MILNSDDCLVLIIDVQEKLLNAVFNKDIVERNSKILAKALTLLNIPIIITEQYPKGLGSSISGIAGLGQTYTKTSFNALLDDELLNLIKNYNKKQIIVFGIETHICVHQTVDALNDLNYEVNVVADACGSRSQFEYLSSLNYMQNQGVKIKTTEMVLFELLKTASHSNFKEIQSLIK